MFLNRFSTRTCSVLKHSYITNFVKQTCQFRYISEARVDEKNRDEDMLELKKRIIEARSAPRMFQDMDVTTFESLYKDDINNKDKIKEILDMYERQKYVSAEVPLSLTEDQMVYLLGSCPNEKEILRALRFMYIKEKKKLSHEVQRQYKKDMRKKQELEKINGDFPDKQITGIFDSNGEISYGLFKNAMVSRVSEQTNRLFRYNHLSRATAMFGQKLIIDLDYDNHMEVYEANLLAKQISILFYENRLNRDFPKELPFDIHFSNCARSVNTMPRLKNLFKKFDIISPYFHDKNYLDYPDLFPKERLVYLSPHAEFSFTNYNMDDIYILGGYNDRTSGQRISHLKAKKEGIRCYKLPLDEFVLWRMGNKNLCLNQVTAILHCVKVTNDWRDAIKRYAPPRKLKSDEEIMFEDNIRQKLLLKRTKAMNKSFNFQNRMPDQKR